jgi:ABC-type multidrug transport system permease subunit
MKIIETITVLETFNLAKKSGLITNFEFIFLRSITKDSNIYNKSENYTNVFDSSSLNKYLRLTTKQKEVYLKIEIKYNQKSEIGDLYTKYKTIFKEKSITLESFDLRHLETFKGVFNESENFKKWVLQIFLIKTNNSEIPNL